MGKTFHKLENPQPAPGCYTLDLYCDHANEEHDFQEFPHEFTGPNERFCKRTARVNGWKIHRDDTATCSKCLAKLKRGEGEG